MNNNLIKMTGPKQAVIGALVFLFPLLCLVTLFGVSLSSFLFVIAAAFFLKDGRAALAHHWPEIRWVVLAFLFNFLYAASIFLLRPGALASIMERPSRMLFAASALMLVLVVKPERRTLWWGVIGGALAGLVLVGYQRVELALDRPGGLINAITFGDLSLCMGLIAMSAAIDMRSTHRALWPSIGALAGLAGSIMTGTRGGWVALALAAFLFIKYSHALNSRRVRALILISFGVVVATYFIPDTGVRERVAQGVQDVRSYFDGGSAVTNVGIRLELWKAAGMIITEHPWFGINDLGDALEVFVKQGKLDPAVLPMPHVHNDALQALVSGGVFGFLAWASILIAPFMFFARRLGAQVNAGRPQFALALAGMLVVASYFSFGLTEVIFFSVKGCLFYALMIFLLMGFCLNEKENHGI